MVNFLNTSENLSPGLSEETQNRQQKRIAFPGIETEVVLKLGESVEDVNVTAQEYIRRHYGKILTYGKGAYVLWILAVVIFVVTHLDILTEEGAKIAFWLVIGPALAYLYFFTHIKKNIQHIFFKQFADANGFHYEKASQVLPRDGAIFQVGNAKNIEDMVTGSFGTFPLAIFNYHYSVGRGKNAVHYEQTILQIDFKSPVPSMLLLIDKKGFGDKLYDNNLRHISKISLPAEIEEHFDLFAEKKFEVEALQIFTPDVLARLYDHHRDFSFDFVGTKLYLYGKKVITTKEEMQSAYDAAQYMINHLADDVRRMRGSLEALQERLR